LLIPVAYRYYSYQGYTVKQILKVDNYISINIESVSFIAINQSPRPYFSGLFDFHVRQLQDFDIPIT